MAETQPVSFRVPPSGFNDLAAVASNAAALDRIVAELNGIPNVQFDMAAAAKLIAERVAIPEQVASDILDGLSSLRSLMERRGLSAEQIVSKIDQSIETQASEAWKIAHLKMWMTAQQQIIGALAAIPSESPLSIRQKARDLTYAHQHVLLDASLITDLRPIYNESGDKMHAMVLTHVLSITHQDGSDSRRIEFALDAADVEKLRNLANRALLKTQTARAALAGTKLALLIPGESVTKE